MAILGFTGKMPVAIGLSFTGDIVPNTINANFANGEYLIANESVTELNVNGLFSGALRVMERKATAKNRLYDGTLNMYVMEPISSSVVEEFLALPKGANLFVGLTFTFNTFFDALLGQMTRTDADLHNLANPNDSKAILDTFTHSAAGGNISIGYKSATQKATGLHAVFVDSDVAAPPKGSKIPAVKIMVQIDFGKTPTPPQVELMRKLMAMDWSKLARFGKPKSGRNDVGIWTENILLYLLNHTDITRGERFRQAIFGRHLGKTPQQLTVDLRNDLDLHLITANHWGQKREDLLTERHQRLLSDLFGTLHQQAWLSSPVFMARELVKRTIGSDLDKTAALALQYGTGHCGEHAVSSFSTLRSIMQAPGNKVSTVILSGNANIDHAFVVFNLPLSGTILTSTVNPKSNRAVGTVMSVFNLRQAIAGNPPGTGFVLDPYLDKSEMKPSAEELLTALNRKERVKNGKDTDFLAFNGIHPPPPPPQTDISGNTPAQRAAQVKNV